MHLTALISSVPNWSRLIGTGGRDPSELVVTIAGMRTHGMTVFEEVNAHKRGSADAPGSSSPGSAGGTSGSASPGPSTQK
jgi:hypothetical protein